MSSFKSCLVSVIHCKSESVSCCEKWRYLVLTVITAESLGKHMYQPSLETYASILHSLRNKVKGLHWITI